jgi:katanin p60 ATPase-containing subunit A1
MMPMRRKISGLSTEQIKALPQDCVDPVSMSDFEKAVQKIQSSVAPGDVERYQKWMNEYGSA